MTKHIDNTSKSIHYLHFYVFNRFAFSKRDNPLNTLKLKLYFLLILLHVLLKEFKLT